MLFSFVHQLSILRSIRIYVIIDVRERSLTEQIMIVILFITLYLIKLASTLTEQINIILEMLTTISYPYDIT